MIIGQAVGLFGNEIVSGTEELVADGCCGFAWVDIYPRKSEANKQFIKALKAEDMVDENKDGRNSQNPNHIFDKISYLGPVHYEYWCIHFGQSMQRKEAFCKAFVEVLERYGITAYVGSRMD